jgi:hypothetical protein
MARTTRAPIGASYAGTLVAPTAVDNTNGEQFVYGGGVNKLVVINGSGGSLNVTMRSNLTTVDGNVVPDKVIAIAAGATRVIREGPSQVQSDGMVYVDYSTGTTITAWLLTG